LDASEALVEARTRLRQRDFASARALCMGVLQAQPANPDALLLHGLACAELGEFPAAADSLGRSLALAPQSPMICVVLADVLLQAGDAAGAEAAARDALGRAPALAAAHNVLGVALQRQGRAGEACAAYREAIASDASNANAWRNLSQGLAALDDLEGAIQARRRAMELPPAGSVEDAHALASLLHRDVRIHEAIGVLQDVLARDPARIGAWLELANCHADLAAHAESRRCYEEVLRRRPGFHQVASTLLVTLHYDARFDAPAVFDAHRAWAARHAASIVPRSHPGRASPGKLRIGFMSPAFREGPSGRFVLPLLQHLDRTRFEVHAYNANGRPDALTGVLQAQADRWRDVWGEDDDAFAERIADDGIDILVDCAGHTPGGRPLVLARKPAPLQVTWLDYFDTTGLDAVDVLVGDAVSTPPGGAQRFTEEVLRLGDCRLCYAPPGYAPAVNTLPALANGHVTFASFNRLSKIVPQVVELWSALLRAVPGSRLIVKNTAMKDPLAKRALLAQFEARGISGERIDARTHSPHAAMLAEYGEADIALDTFPYNGGLTSCEALWMGLPVLCLMGDSMISRQTAAIMTAAGMPEWIARDAEHFVEIGAAAAADLSRLALLRASMRERLAASALMDAKAFAERFGALMLEAWSREARGGRA
jgi:predicted O-linked N-acetylglucosamine transferase (SPINDLY family)